MKKISIALSFLLFSMELSAQTMQRGVVKTIGRPDKAGVPLSNVVIRFRGMVNQVLSKGDGTFSVVSPDKKEGDAIVLQSVQKNGYELKDPGLIGRQQVFSLKVPIVILMVDSRQLERDKKRIEDNAYRVAEQNYQKKLAALNKQKVANEITAEKYRQQLIDLKDKFDKYRSLIGDMADRYARTDYDQLDSTDREINICIENGELDKADSLIHTVFDPETVLQRNREAKEAIGQRIAFAQSIIDKANADREAIMRDMDYAKRVSILCDNLAAEYMTQGVNTKAIECLIKSLEIKTILYGDDSSEVKKTKEQLNTLR